VAVSVAKFTSADATPGTCASDLSTRVTQAAQDMPSIARDQSVGGLVAVEVLDDEDMGLTLPSWEG